MELLRKMYNLFSDTKFFSVYDFITPVIIIRDPDLIFTPLNNSIISFRLHQQNSRSDSK